MIPSADEAAHELTPSEQAQPTRIVDGQWLQVVAGSPDQVRATLDEMVEASGADEIMVQDFLVSRRARITPVTRLREILDRPLHAGRSEDVDRACAPPRRR